MSYQFRRINNNLKYNITNAQTFAYNKHEYYCIKKRPV